MQAASDQEGSAGLVRAVTDESPYVRECAAKRLRVLASGQDTRAAELLALLLRDEEVAVREAAVEALGELNHPRAAVLLRRALRDENVTVRQAAGDALGGLAQRALNELERRCAGPPSVGPQ